MTRRLHGTEVAEILTNSVTRIGRRCRRVLIPLRPYPDPFQPHPRPL